MARAKLPTDDAAAAELDRMATRIRRDIHRQEIQARPPWPDGMNEFAIESAKCSVRERIVAMRWCERMLRSRASRLRNGTAGES